jgi:hypothetical protein
LKGAWLWPIRKGAWESFAAGGRRRKVNSESYTTVLREYVASRVQRNERYQLILNNAATLINEKLELHRQYPPQFSIFDPFGVMYKEHVHSSFLRYLLDLRAIGNL